MPQSRGAATEHGSTPLPLWGGNREPITMLAFILLAIAAVAAEEASSGSVPADQQAEHRAEVSHVAPWGWTLELVSLSKSRVRASEGQQPIWDTEQSGIDMRPLPDAPPPAQKAATRLSQMRKLVERFSIDLDDGRTNEEIHRRLRVLPQPLYRYSSDEDNVVDGALYAVSEATDPEVWILLEAVGHAGGTSWRYALARMNMWPMQVRLDGNIVQTWEKIAKPYGNRKAVYTLWPFSPGGAASTSSVDQ